MQPIIEVQHIGKKFRIFHKDAPYLSLRDSIVSFAKNPFKVFQNNNEEFWALKDVSFNVMPGESIGIIGRNGAGKSTLLKILSRITPPTEGKIILRGRVASLLEVGTGFHPELTGRENVYFNGAILGMKRSEIKRKFDEIVDFAGVEKFIDTPLKHYSSGMQLRLAFAVAAFLEAEILVVDEVLAVGDAEFQKKCLGKMEQVTKNEGRTVLFVSHNMGAVKQLCNKTLLLEKSKLKRIGATSDVINDYYNVIETRPYFDEKGIVKRVYIISNNAENNTILAGSDFKLRIQYECNEQLKNAVIGIVILNEYDEALLGINNEHYGKEFKVLPYKGIIEIDFSYIPLYSGNYSIDLYFGVRGRDLQILKKCIFFKVEKSHIGTSKYMLDEKLNKILFKDVYWNAIQQD